MDSQYCFKCKSNILMVDGSVWCSFVMKPVSLLEYCYGKFEEGSSIVYKPKPVQVPRRITKTTTKEIKPKKVMSNIIKKKKPSQQQKLF